MSLLKGLEQNQTFLNSVLMEVGGMYEEGEGEVFHGHVPKNIIVKISRVE